jgi:hypothetical protein
MQGDHGAAAVKTGLARGLVVAENCNQPFQSFTNAGRLLALWASRRYISGEFPDKKSDGVGFAHGFRSKTPML